MRIRALRKRFAAAAFASLVVLTLVSSGVDGAWAQESGEARNVIIFVGDGMGTSHRDLIRYATVGTDGALAMDSLPYAGMSRTSPDDPDEFVTDSAAGGTSIATGIKTFNGAVGVDVDGNPVTSVLEEAERAGKATGLVTNSQVTDATPASFGAHVEDRDNQSEIARQYLESSKPEVILGGGEDYWYPEGDAGAFPDEPPEDREEVSAGTKGNLVRAAESLGYEYVTTASELQAATGPKILGLFANEEMFQQAPEGQGDVYEPTVSLPEMTRKAIEVLSTNPNGFFLLVEEEGIDEMAHQSNAELVIEAGQQLDAAVEVGKAYAQSDPGTLLIVTADHETGSLAIEDTNKIQDDPDYPNETGEGRTAEDGPFDVAGSDHQFVVDWTTANHTAEDVPLTALGPGAENLTGVYQNTHIYEAMMQALFGSSSASASASASTSASASASQGAGEVPDTGGPTVVTLPLMLTFAALLAGVVGLFFLRRVLSKP